MCLRSLEGLEALNNLPTLGSLDDLEALNNLPTLGSLDHLEGLLDYYLNLARLLRTLE